MNALVLLAAAALLAGHVDDRHAPDRPWSPAPNTVPLFDIYPADPAAPPSVNSLPAELVVNTTTMTPVFRYRGSDATAASWPAWGTGSTAATTATGTDPTVGVDTPLLGPDRAVLFNNGDGYQVAGATDGDLTTEDYAIEVVLRFSGATSDGIVSKIDSGFTEGWAVYNSSSTVVSLIVGDTTGGQNDTVTIACPALVAGAWYVLHFFGDASGSGICYANAAAGSGAAISGISTMTNASKLTIGAERTTAANPYSDRILYAAMWKCAGCFDTHAQAAVAKERLQRLAGVWPRIAPGGQVATTMTRASTAYTRKRSAGVTTLFLMGENWPRVERTATGTAFVVEQTKTELALQTRDVATTWAELDSGDTQSLNAIASPAEGDSLADGNIADSTDGIHGFSQAVTLTASAYTLSVYAKAGNQAWAYLDNTTVANATGYFNLSTCATGTKGAGATELLVEDLGNGWCRLSMTFTGTVAAHTVRMASAQADGDNTIAGDGAAVNTYWWGMNAVTGAHPQSVIQAAGSTASRTVDLLDFTAANNANRLGGTLACSFFTDSYDGIGAFGVLMAHTSTTDYVFLGNTATGDASVCQVLSGNVTQANISGTTDVMNGAAHTATCSWGANDARLYVDGLSEGTPDTAVTVPASLTSIKVANAAAGTSGDFAIQRCRIYDVAGVVR